MIRDRLFNSYFFDVLLVILITISIILEVINFTGKKEDELPKIAVVSPMLVTTELNEHYGNNQTTLTDAMAFVTKQMTKLKNEKWLIINGESMVAVPDEYLITAKDLLGGKYPTPRELKEMLNEF